MAINKKIPIIALILFLGIALPQISAASSFMEKFLEDAGLTVVRAIIKFAQMIARFLVDLAADFFELIFVSGLRGHQNVAKVGWDVTRDFANMFFILFMVIIAFATILRIERYGIKELLPKVIMIALLINFSMVICYVIIDFSNIVAYFFVSEAKSSVPGHEVSLSAILSDSFRLPDLYVPFTCQYYEQQLLECYDHTSEAAILNCVENAEKALMECYESGGMTKTEETDFWDIMIAGFGTTIILLIAAFVLFAGGIFLVIRLVAIWFLVMIAPIAFICYILPALRKNWESWWSQFIRWCLFAPIFTFFVWLAAKISLEQKLVQFAALSPSITQSGADPVNQFFASIGNILHFLFISGILIGGLLAANKLGITGASTAMMIGKKWTGAAKGWAKKQTMRPVKGAAQRVGAGAAIAGGGIRAWAGKTIGGRFGRRMEAKGIATKQSAAEQVYNKKYEAMLKTMSGENLLKEVKSAKGSRALIAARTAQSRGLLKTDATKQEAKAAANAFKTYGATDAARQLEESRLDIIDGVEALAQTIKRLATEGNLDKVSAASFASDPDDPGSAARVTRAIIENTNSEQQESLIKRSKQHADNWGKSLEQMTAPVTPGAARTAAQEEMTRMDAANQEKTHKAYATKSGDIDRMTVDMLRGWAQKAGPDGIKNLKSTSDPIRIGIVAQNIPTNQLATAVEKMSDDATVKVLIRHLKSLNPAFLATDPNALANHNAAMNNPLLKDLA